MGGWIKAGGFEFCRMDVDLHQRGADKLANIHYGNGGVFEATFAVHHAMHELGLCGYFRWSRVGFRKPSMKKRWWAWNWITRLKFLCGSVVRGLVCCSGGQDLRQNTQKVESEQGDGRMGFGRESWTLTRLVAAAFFNSKIMHRVSISSSCSCPKWRTLSKVKKLQPFFSHANTETQERRQSKDWYGNTKSRWQQPTGGDGRQSSHDTWNSQPWGKWKEISAEVDAVRSTVKGQTST